VAGDVEFLDRADDEVELGQDLLEMRGDPVGRDVARLAVAAVGEPPQHRPVVDVEHRAHAVLARAVERQVADAIDVVGREVGAGDEQRARLRDVGLLDVVLVDGHVGAVLAQEDERERVLVLDSQHHRGRQARRVHPDVADVAALLGDGLDQEPAVGVVADARHERRLEAEAGGAERGVRRRAAEVLGEARHVLEPRADLLGVEIDAETAEADDIQPAVGSETGGVFHCGSCGQRLRCTFREADDHCRAASHEPQVSVRCRFGTFIPAARRPPEADVRGTPR
jgi:hypothetical protein